MSESLSDKVKGLKEDAISAGLTGAMNLIEVAKADIMQPKKGDPLAADKLKQAAAAIKMALFDCFEILARIEEEERKMNEGNEDDKPKVKEDNINEEEVDNFKFAEGRAK